MMEFFQTLFLAGSYMPHGQCYLWTPGLVWLHVISDGLIALAYYSIPLTLAWFVRKRTDLDFRWMFLCFAAFILACGTTHLMEIWNVWHGHYWLSGAIKAVTAAVSIPTAILLTRLMPQALTVPSPKSLQQANLRLRETADARAAVEAQLREVNRELESRVTERTAALEAANAQLRRQIKESQQSELIAARLAAIVESSVDAIIGKDLQSIVTSWNAGAERMFGYTAEEMIGRSITLLIPPDREDDEKQILARIKRGERVEHFETVRRRKDGGLIDVSVTVSPIRDASGAIVGASKVARDITEQKRFGEERENLLRLIEHSPDFIATADLEGRITFMNSGARKMIGWDLEKDPHTLHFTDYVPPEWRDFFLRTVLATAEERGLWEGEMQLRHIQTGALVDVFRSTFLLRNAAGQPSAFATVTRDITKAKRAELELRKSRETLRLTLDAARIGHWDLDLITREASRSVQHDRIFGYEELLPEWNYERFLAHVHPEDRAWVDRLFQAGVAAKTEWDFECRILRGDGVERWIWVHGNVFTNAAHEAVQMLGMVSDITERKNAEQRAVWLATFPERNPNPILELDLNDGVFHYLNSAALRQFPDLPTRGLQHPLVAGLEKIAAGLAEKGTLWREVEVGEFFLAQVITYIPESRRLRIYSADITDRRQAEWALSKKEAQLHTADRRLAEIVHGMTEACFALDREWRFTFVNERGEMLLRHSREQMLGHKIWEVFSKLVGTPMENYYRHAMTERVPVTFEVFSPIAERWLDIRLFPTPEGLAAFLLDIDARKQAEDSTRESEERLQAVTENLTEGLVVSNLEGQMLHWNRAALEMCGYHSLAEGLRVFREFAETFELTTLDGEILSVEQWPMSRVLSGEVLRDYEVNIRRRDRDWSRIFSYSGTIVHNASGQPLAFLAMNDITARQRTEAALRESEENFRFLNDLGEATRAQTDAEQIMAVMAQMLGEHLGVSRCAYADVEEDSEHFTILHDYTDGCASTVGRYQLSFFGPRAVSTLRGGQTLIIRHVQEELSTEGGAEMFHAIGIQAIITCPLVKEGRLRGLMAVHQATPRDWQPGEIALVQDVAERCWATIERRIAEEELHKLNAVLEQRVAERTAQLESANQELEAFSYSVSHDLRAPLRAIDGFSQAVLEDYGPQLPDSGQRQLHIIREGAQRMGVLIDDLLTFSRLSRSPMTRRAVDCEKLVRDSLEDLQGQRAGRQIELRIGALPPCTGDPALLKQVWINLLSNALKYSRESQPAIIEVGWQPGGKLHQLVYFVRDNGTGFDMRYAGKLFGVFQRLHRAEDYEGTGVGLAIVQRVIHRHGGRIWAEAAVGRGATFYFTLEGETEL